MSDETPTPDEGAAPPEAAAEESAPSSAVATVDGAAAPAPAAAEPVTFTRKFLLPLLVPIGVAATIIFYVLNVSRIFLAGEDALAVIFAIVITCAILFGGTALAAAPRLRSSSITLILGGGLLVVLMGGLISIGNASPSGSGGPTQCSPVTSKIVIDAGANNTLRFTPMTPTAKAGCVQITLKILTSTHTLQFDDPVAANVFQQLDVNTPTWAGMLPAGTYKFHCTIQGHEQAGMVGTLTVT